MLWCRKIQGAPLPLLCLHGWGQTHYNLEGLAELLKCESSPVLFDLPGFGNSPAPPSVWSAVDYAKAFIQYMDDNNIEKASLLGHSFGGKIAMCTAINFPQRIHKLVLLAPSGISPRLSRKKKSGKISFGLLQKRLNKSTICAGHLFLKTNLFPASALLTTGKLKTCVQPW